MQEIIDWFKEQDPVKLLSGAVFAFFIVLVAFKVIFGKGKKNA